jgi:ribosome-binding factor A
MSSRRVQKAAEAIREVVSMAILTELQDPRVQNVTVTYVEVAGDMRHAKIHVSVMGDEKEQQLTVHGLQHAAGFLQWKVAQEIDLRYTPRLTFVLDQGVKKSIEIAQILQRVLPKTDEPPPADDEGEAADDAAAETDATDAAAEEDDSAEPPSGRPRPPEQL